MLTWQHCDITQRISIT